MSLIRLFLVALVLVRAAVPLSAATQSFNLSSQWNLITFQVIPDDPEPARVFATLPGFQSAWSYDAGQAAWQRYIKPSGSSVQQANDALVNVLLPLPPIEPGRAYWVFTSQATPAWQVQGTLPAGVDFRGLDLKQGWNMVGIPVGATTITNTEPVSLLAVLTAAGFDYDALLTWENQTFRKMFRPQPSAPGDPPHPLEGLPPDAPLPGFNLQQDLARGYWIRVLDPAVLRPRLMATVRPDVDAEPLDNFPSREDSNVSGGARVKSVLEQDVIRFFPGEDVQTVGIANLGESGSGGGGILLWEAVWEPETDLNTPEPWIRLFASTQQREVRDHEGRLLSSHSRLSGVTTLESDTVYLRLDRRHLGRGVHEGTLTLRTSVGDKAYRVVAEVPGLAGDFRGHAVIQSVNGKRNPVPDIDLNLTFYEDNKIPGLLRGLIDSSQALLWPVDVPLVGYRVADEGNRFYLGGSFVLPPGDQNGEPFDVWNESDPAAGADVDWADDDVLDIRNPFPFPVQRTLSLEGTLVAANPTDGYVLQGNYREIVHGMTRTPIVLSGTFSLQRQAVRPFTSRRSVSQDTGTQAVIEKINAVPLTIPAGATRDSALGVRTEMELQNLQANLMFSRPLPHAALLIKLVSPATPPVEVVLYDGRTAVGAINARLLEDITFPLDRPTAGDLESFLRTVPKTQTESGLAQFWRLVIQNVGSQSVTLSQWTLRLEGQPVADVHGVVEAEGAPVAGVRVALDGVPFSLYSTVTDAQGRFALWRVPLLPVNFSGARPGYVPADPTNPGLEAPFTLPFVGQSGRVFTPVEQRFIARFNPLAGAPANAAGVPGFTAGTTNSPFIIRLRPETAGAPRLNAGPLVAHVGTTVTFDAVNATGTVLWDFGDQTFADSSSASHAYQAPGVYRAQMFSPADSVTAQDSVLLVVLPAPSHAPAKPADLRGESLGLHPQTMAAPYAAHLFQFISTSGGVIPAHKVGTDPLTGADRYLSDIAPQTAFATGETNAFGAAFVSATPLQMMYAATMDMDLAPRGTSVDQTQPFEADGFLPLNSPGFDPAINVNDQGFKQEDFNYALVAALWQNTRASDGENEYAQDEQNGLIVWGNPLLTPNQNYALQTAEARDGAAYVVALDDAQYHPHSGTTRLADVSPPQAVTHLRLAVSLGAPILTVPVSGGSVRAAKVRRGQLDNPLEPGLLPAPSPPARNLYYQLLTGPLGEEVWP